MTFCEKRYTKITTDLKLNLSYDISFIGVNVIFMCINPTNSTLTLVFIYLLSVSIRLTIRKNFIKFVELHKDDERGTRCEKSLKRTRRYLS